MAQLVKLQNYISRYEKDIFHYPGQFSRMKKEKWNKTLEHWEAERHSSEQELERFQQTEQASMAKWRSLFSKQNKQEEIWSGEKEKPGLPHTKEDLKHQFLDRLVAFQLKWASSTVSQMSFLDRSFLQDQTLKYFLQRFPDTYLFMYEPVFTLKNSTMEGDIVFIQPQGIEIINLVENPAADTIFAKEERMWEITIQGNKERLLSPMLSLRRTEQVIKSILDLHQVEFPIQKTVLSRMNSIQSEHVPFRTRFVDKQGHDEWLQQHRQEVSPLKHNQLVVCKALLDHCQTVAVRRREWEENDGSQPL
ncbi:hypothetical protein [Sediminibacillus halophilus]|uniref:Nuclease-related domain-containing protein n=1 Tax=Sediminibacillus halophilus TaxID=482461 RepID=A0A1G9Y2H4_9BACI|nr:hypothetical protein [Sediminibacillus halophilus]SDN03267.1 hypothetical protein SAMN05216244_4020 [Sediminibacillus halophilus]